MAKKTGYRFNPETLSYDEVDSTLGHKIRRLFIKFIQSLSLALIMFLLASIFIDSPKEKLLKREQSELLAQYDILNQQIEQLGKVISDIEKRDDNIYRVIFESEPISPSIRRAGTGGVDKYENIKDMNNADLVISTSKKLDKLLKATYIQSKSYDEVEGLVKNKIDMYASIPAIFPVSLNSKNVRFSSSFGYRMHPIYKTMKLHSGIDISGPIGTPIYATGDGKVEYAETRQGYGKTILIDHGYNHKTKYGHLNAYAVKKGQKIKRGELIGYMGNTGRSVGPHLHYEVLKNGSAINPTNYFFNDLTPDEYDELIAKSELHMQTLD